MKQTETVTAAGPQRGTRASAGRHAAPRLHDTPPCPACSPHAPHAHILQHPSIQPPPAASQGQVPRARHRQAPVPAHEATHRRGAARATHRGSSSPFPTLPKGATASTLAPPAGRAPSLKNAPGGPPPRARHDSPPLPTPTTDQRRTRVQYPETPPPHPPPRPCRRRRLTVECRGT